MNFIKNYFSRLTEIMNAIDVKSIEKVIEIFDKTRISGNNIYFIGNGGSAATAAHFSNDLNSIKLNPKFKARSLAVNMATITAIANDYDYESVFSKQLESCLKKDDVLVAISASGNSKNIIKAMTCAGKIGAMTIGLTGFGGGELKDISMHVVYVKTNKGEYGPVEDVHLILDHLISAYFIEKIKRRR